MQKYDRFKKQYEKDPQTMIHFDKPYKKSLQDILIDKSEHECLCNVLTKHLIETKNESFS